jgi:tRNA-2-methylthio-N6-dimethylallyladenosine synthase
MKYYIKTYGCQMNYSDSERIAGILDLAGYEKALGENKTDLIVLNICSVRKSAVDKIAGNFKKYKKYKARNPNFKTVITGCVLESDREKFEKLFDLIIDIKEIEKLPEKLNTKTKICHSEFISESITDFKKNDAMQIDQNILAIKTKQNVNQRKILNQIQDEKMQIINNKHIYNNDDYFKISPKHQSKITAFVPIMTGCDNFCSYCVVPYTRGREKSRPVEEIIDEIASLIKNGCKEIILLGQNVNSYSAKFSIFNFQFSIKSQISKLKIQNSDSITFPVLLRLINAIPGDFWIRFLTSHPKDMTEELIKTVAECEKCTEYIHLALQSGDDDILEKMNRKYTAKYYLDLVKKIRNAYKKDSPLLKNCPSIAISTDVIVGFPGETKKQFQNTVKVMEEAKFDMAYLNKYSPRAGTASAKLKDDVSWKEKKNREDILNKVLRETALENNQKYVGKVVEVLVEKINEKFMYGKTRSFKNVKIESSIKHQVSSIKQGQFSKIKITRAEAWGLEGEMV